MRIKFNRGPMKNKRSEIQDGQYQVLVSMPADNWSLINKPEDYFKPITTKVGVYQKSYQTLKDGTIVFEWMGWRE